MQRYRHDDMGMRFTQGRFRLLGPQFTQQLGKAVAAQMLKTKNHVTEQTVIGTKPQYALEAKR